MIAAFLVIFATFLVVPTCPGGLRKSDLAFISPRSEIAIQVAKLGFQSQI